MAYPNILITLPIGKNRALFVETSLGRYSIYIESEDGTVRSVSSNMSGETAVFKWKRIISDLKLKTGAEVETEALIPPLPQTVLPGVLQTGTTPGTTTYQPSLYSWLASSLQGKERPLSHLKSLEYDPQKIPKRQMPRTKEELETDERW